MEEIHPGNVLRHGFAFLIDVVRHAGHVRVKHHHHETPGALRRVLPDQFRVAVGAKAHVVLFAVDTKREFLRHRLAFFNTSNLDFHSPVLLYP